MIKDLLNKKTWIRWKAFADRARWYMAFGQTVLQVATYLSVSGGSLNLLQWFLISVSTVISFIIVGFVDVKLFRALQEEQRYLSEQNPVINEMSKQIKGIYEHLKIH